MERPLFVLDDDWRFRYINPAGAAAARAAPSTRWSGGSSGTSSPRRSTARSRSYYRRVRGDRRTGQLRGVVRARWQIWFQVDAFRTDGGLVVTYDDVTERRRDRGGAGGRRRRPRGAAAAAAAAAAAEAEAAGRHLMLLGDINLAMTSTFDTDEAVDRFAHLVVPLLADWCLVSVFDPDGTRRDVGRAHRDPALVEAMHRYADLRVATNLPTRAGADGCCASRRPVVIPELHRRASRRWSPTRGAARRWQPLRPAAVAAFPLRRPRRGCSARSPWSTGPSAGPHTAAELRTAEIASRRAALALDNARLAAANQQVAERLQLSLLSPPVQPDHLELAVRYRPATQGVSIGGDWYDAFLQPDGDTVLVIGDVMGHDIEAAAAMGQVKTLVRGIAFDRLEEPAGVLRRVDHALVGLAVPDAWRPRWSAGSSRTTRSGRRGCAGCAGRRPGTRIRCCCGADGTVVDLAAPVGPPLGIGWLGAAVDGAGARCPRAARCCCSPTGCSSGAACRWTRAARRSASSCAGSADLPARGAVRPAARRAARGGRRGRRRRPRRARAPGGRAAPGRGRARVLPPAVRPA